MSKDFFANHVVRRMFEIANFQSVDGTPSPLQMEM